ncbi:MAG: ABC transporter permease [Nevskiales bacterium]
MNKSVIALRYSGRRLKRIGDFGELRVLALAIIVAVAAASAVGLFSDRMRSALEAQSAEALGADILLTGREPLPAELANTAEALGLRSLSHLNFPSLVIGGSKSTLAAIKAVNTGYPLAGELRIASAAYETAAATDQIPQPGEAWADIRLWNELELKPGDSVQVGSLALRITAFLEYEPDRGVGFVDLAPRLLINHADVEASGLLGPGSRVQYTRMFAGPAAAIQSLRQNSELAPSLRWITPAEARPEIRSALDRAGQFLDIAVLAVTLLAAVAIGLTAQQHGMRLRDEVAVLKCMGASRGFVFQSHLFSLLLMGVLSTLLGLLVGYGGQAILASLLAGLVQGLNLPAPALTAVVSPAILALIMLLGFAVPPIYTAADTPPMRVFQRSADQTRGTTVIWLAAIAAAIGLLAWQTREPKLAGLVLAGTAVSLAILAVVSWLLVRIFAGLRSRGGLGWRFGLGNISRRSGKTVGQAVALGLGLLALLLVSVVREDLLDAWQDRLPPDTPNVFLINIQSEQLDSLRDFFGDHGYTDLKLWPMARGRLVALNGEPVTVDSFDDPETRRWINRDFNMSWTDSIGWDNKITEGEWWGEAVRNQALLSAEEYARERLGVQIGDRLTLQFGPEQIEFTIHHFREVQWDSFQPNFFLLTPPGVLDDVPAQWLTSFYLPREQRELLRELVTQLPNITALDLDAAMNQVRSIVNRLVSAVEFMLLFTLAAGLVVLLAAIEGTRGERARETALLRALGARSASLRRGLLAEFLALGLVAGLVAGAAAQAVAWALASQVFDIPYGLSPALWLISAGMGAGLVTLFGWLSLRSVLKTPPTRVLQGSG